MGGPYGGDGIGVSPHNGGGSATPSGNGSTDGDGGSVGTGTGTDGGSGRVDAGQGGGTDSGGPPPPKDAGVVVSAPTWTQIHNSYLVSSLGHCQDCHSSFSSPSSSYSYLRGKGYINGAHSPLVDSSQSCLTWYGGNMPKNPTGPQPQAVSDMNAWAAAGAQNN